MNGPDALIIPGESGFFTDAGAYRVIFGDRTVPLSCGPRSRANTLGSI